MGCYSRYNEEGPGRAMALPSPLLTVLNVSMQMANVPITVLQYNNQLLCGCNVRIAGLNLQQLIKYFCSTSEWTCLLFMITCTTRLSQGNDIRDSLTPLNPNYVKVVSVVALVSHC